MSKQELTKEQILDLKPGREMDILIAIHIMGFKEDKHRTGMVIQGNISSFPRPYSTNISAAWAVVDHFKNKGYLFTLKNLVGGQFEFSLTDWDGMCSTYRGQGDTPSVAICKATLLAVMGGSGNE